MRLVDMEIGLYKIYINNNRLQNNENQSIASNLEQSIVAMFAEIAIFVLIIEFFLRYFIRTSFKCRKILSLRMCEISNNF